MRHSYYKNLWCLFFGAFAVATVAKNVYDDEDESDDLDRFCNTHTQTSIAVSMFEHSSPRGSSSYQQLNNMLSSFPNFYANSIAAFGENGLFDEVAENLSQMLEGYGLQKSHDHKDASAIILGTVFMNEYGLEMIRNNDRAVLLLQTEQLCCSGFLSMDVNRNLQACEVASNCIILEYSEHNYNWMAKELNVSASVVLLPTLLQGRLDEYYRRHHLPPTWERTVDIVFFGTMTQHRKSVLEQIQDPNPNNQQWNMVMQVNHDKLKMVQTYLHAKICLTVHAFETSGPGEYHRLSELAASGCVPVMESFDETLSIDVYQLCGGVVFADFQDLPNQIADIIGDTDEEEQDENMHRRVRWWRNRVEWGKLLHQMYRKENKTEQEL
jgi:hypothetical protein